MASVFLINIFCCTLILFSLSLTNGQETPLNSVAKQPEQPIDPSPFVRSMNEFGFNLINEINPSVEPPAEQIAPQNVLFSPQGLATILAMLHQGATQQTAQQFEQALGFDPSLIEKSQIPKMTLDAMYAINSTESPGTIVFINNTYLLKNANLQMTSEYVQMIQEFFDAHIMFTGDGQIVCEDPEKPVENDAASNSNDLIVKNFVSFKGNWFYPCQEDKSVIDTFYGLNETKYENVTFMTQHGRFGFVSLYDLEADMVELPMKGDNIAMYAILPRDPSDDLSDIRSTLNVSYIEEMIHKLSYRLESTVSMPRMDLEMKYNQMIGYLMKLGIKDAFNADDAKFEIMSNKGPIYIRQVMHSVKMELKENVPSKQIADESESQPSSPQIDAALGSMAKPLMFEFNHPFFYFIRHKQNGQIFIMGEMHSF